jgi:hypothetical protein
MSLYEVSHVYLPETKECPLVATICALYTKDEVYINEN